MECGGLHFLPQSLTPLSIHIPFSMCFAILPTEGVEYIFQSSFDFGFTYVGFFEHIMRQK